MNSPLWDDAAYDALADIWVVATPTEREGIEAAVHRVNAKFGEGWGSHLGFDEIHQEFIACIRENRPPLTTVRNCIDGTLLAIAAERSIREANVIAIE